MKVLQVLPELNAGGVEQGTIEFARFLVAGGHRAAVISAGGRRVPELSVAGAEHTTLPVHRKSPVSLRAVPKLRAWMRHERPDVVHVRSRVPAWLTWLAWRSLPRAKRPRLVTTVHGFYSVNRYSAVMTRGEAVICVSRSVRDYVVRHYPACPPERLTVVHRGVDPAAYPHGHRPAEGSPAAELRTRRADRFLVCLPGRLTAWKGQRAFLKLIGDLRGRGLPVHGLIAGGPHPRRADYADDLRVRAAAAGLDDDVTFLGDRRDLKDVLSVCDAVVSLSQDPEAFGRVTLEALALGRPTLGYAHGGVAEQLDALYPAGRVPPHDLDAAGRTLARWIADGPPPVPAGVGPFTLDAMCRGVLGVYEGLLASPRG